MNDLLDSEGESSAKTWHIISQCVVGLDDPMPDRIDPRTLLTPPIHEKVGTAFLQCQKADKGWRFLSTDQLISIASKVETAEIDIDQAPGVYVFCSLVDEDVLKVGQSSDLRRRIAREHLQKNCMNTDSLLIDYAKRNWIVGKDADWHDSLNANEITALIFPMHGSGEVDRLLIELSLTGMLHPIMP